MISHTVMYLVMQQTGCTTNALNLSRNLLAIQNLASVYRGSYIGVVAWSEGVTIMQK